MDLEVLLFFAIYLGQISYFSHLLVILCKLVTLIHRFIIHG